MTWPELLTAPNAKSPTTFLIYEIQCTRDSVDIAGYVGVANAMICVCVCMCVNDVYE